MSGRRNSVFIPTGSMTSIRKISPPRTESDSDISNFSFKHWHKRMQSEHERLEIAGESSSFKLWKWCDKGCQPCRKFDSIKYDKKICKCCLKFRTFKTLGTIILIAVFFYIFMFSILKDEVLPGGSFFFILFLFLTAYLTGYIVMLVGLPPMMGHLIIGIIFGNVPPNLLPPRNNELIEETAKYSEKILLVVALIRAGLLLDLSRIKNRLLFILRVAVFPFSCEFIIVWISSHLLLKLPWDWSALQGSVMSIVSLASVTSVMEKNKQSGYGEDKHLSTVLIAASALNVIFGLVLYTVCITYLFPEGGQTFNFWKILLGVLKQILIGLSVGLVSGLLVAFFPDKRNTEAAALRIITIGCGSFAIASVLNEFNMPAAGAIGCLTMCLIATNMWEELGWHQDSNPVQYFYTMAYYLSQPIVLSLVGFTMNFSNSEGKEIGLSIVVLLIGIAGRESVCFAAVSGKSYPTTTKEKIFICIAWISKGTFQALLAFTVKYMINKRSDSISEATLEVFLEYSGCIKRTTILAILLTTPLACYSLTLLTPRLLTKTERPSHPAESADPNAQEASKNSRKRQSFIKFQEKFYPKRKKTLDRSDAEKSQEPNSNDPG